MENPKKSWWARWWMWPVYAIAAMFAIALIDISNDGAYKAGHATTAPAQDTQASTTIPNYTIVNKIQTRYDEGNSYYVLIDKTDLSNDSFREIVKSVVRDIVAKKGQKVSIEIFDDMGALEVSYKQYGEMSLGRVLTASEDLLLERHYIAAYSGQLETGLYKNSLMFFPAAFTSSDTVGDYVDTIEFNP